MFCFRGTCYHVGDEIQSKDNGYGEKSYCPNLKEPGRLAILPDSRTDVHTLAQVIDENRFYQIGNSINIIRKILIVRFNFILKMKFGDNDVSQHLIMGIRPICGPIPTFVPIWWKMDEAQKISVEHPNSRPAWGCVSNGLFQKESGRWSKYRKHLNDWRKFLLQPNSPFFSVWSYMWIYWYASHYIQLIIENKAWVYSITFSHIYMLTYLFLHLNR